MLLGGSARRTPVAQSTGRGLPQPNGASDSICRTVSSVSWQNGPSASMRISPTRDRARCFAGGVLAERGAKGVDPRFVDLQAGRRRVAAEAEQMLGAGRQRRVQIEAMGERAEPMPGFTPSSSSAISTTGR